jgi:hypothetical protein
MLTFLLTWSLISQREQIARCCDDADNAAFSVKVTVQFVANSELQFSIICCCCVCCDAVCAGYEAAK